MTRFFTDRESERVMQACPVPGAMRTREEWEQFEMEAHFVRAANHLRDEMRAGGYEYAMSDEEWRNFCAWLAQEPTEEVARAMWLRSAKETA